MVADNDRAARATLAAIRWFKTAAPRNVRDRWDLSAVLLSYANDATPAQQLEFPPAKGFFDHPNSRRAGICGDGWPIRRPILCCRSAVETCCRASTPPVGLAGGGDGRRIGNRYCARRVRLGARNRRPGTASARAERRGRHAACRRSARRSWRGRRAIRWRLRASSQPDIRRHPLVSYIPSVAWANTLRLADITKDDALRQKVLSETRPWLSARAAAVWRARGADRCRGHAHLRRPREARRRVGPRRLRLQGAEEALKVAPTGLRAAWRRLDRRHVHAGGDSVAIGHDARPGARSRSSGRHAHLVRGPTAARGRRVRAFHRRTDRVGARKRICGARPDRGAHVASGDAPVSRTRCWRSIGVT